MNAVVDALLAFAVLVAWITAAALLRWRCNYNGVHAVTFFNLVGGGAITAAVVISDGLGSRTLLSVLIWLVMVSAGSLLSHAIARALHLPDKGEP